MNKKIAIIAASLLLLSVCLCSCVHIADTNGEEDYSLGELTEEDKKAIETEIDSLVLMFQLQNSAYGLDDDACISAMYGKGMKKGDVYNARRISMIADKSSAAMEEEAKASAANDDRVNAKYEANKIKYDAIDYLTYEFKVDYSKDKGEAKYKEEIAAAKEAAKALAAKTTPEEFKAYIYNYVADKNYNSLFEQQKFTSDDCPTDTELATIKENIIKNVVAQALSGEAAVKTGVVETKVEGADPTYKIYDITIKKAFADGIKKVEENLFTNVKTQGAYSEKKEVNYKEDDTFSTWAFDANTATNAVKTIEIGDGANGAEIKTEAKTFKSTVYLITKTRYKDENKTKQVAYMIFGTEDDAKKAIQKLDNTTNLTVEEFNKVAAENNASYKYVIDSYLKGQMQSASFDEWLYRADTVVGSYTKTPIDLYEGDTAYAVAYYVKENDAFTWRATIENELATEDYKKALDDITVKYGGEKVKEYNWAKKLVLFG